MRNRFLALAAMLAALVAMPIRSRASAPHLITISGTGAAVQVSTTDQQASSLQFTAPSGNMGTARIGGTTTSSSVGEALPAGSGQYFPPRWQGSYSLNTWYVYVANGDTVTILWVDNL
jgi:hypothetical protein